MSRWLTTMRTLAWNSPCSCACGAELELGRPCWAHILFSQMAYSRGNGRIGVGARPRVEQNGQCKRACGREGWSCLPGGLNKLLWPLRLKHLYLKFLWPQS